MAVHRTSQQIWLRRLNEYASSKRARQSSPGRISLERHPLLSQASKPYKLAFVFGTRPELIKMAPLIKEAKKHPDIFQILLVHTGQHREMTRGILPIFGISEKEINYNLRAMEHGGPLEEKVGYMLAKLGRDIMAKERPDMVVVQGDTESTLAAKMAADYHNIPVAYVEAGLRSHSMLYPFPEEMHRRYAACTPENTLYFAPTALARDNLMREGVPDEKIFVTGNTGIDALNMAKQQRVDIGWLKLPKRKKIIVLTCHRREAFGQGMKAIFGVIRAIAKKYKDKVHFIYPVHLNPVVRKIAASSLGDVDNVQLVRPLHYLEMIELIRRSYLVLTDSGGLQEEVPSFRKPLIVLRNVTERPEGIDAGVVEIAGFDKPEEISSKIEELLVDKEKYKRMTMPTKLYGDGNASKRIMQAIQEYFGIIYVDASQLPAVKAPQMAARTSYEPDLNKMFTIAGSITLSKLVSNIKFSIEESIKWLLTSGAQNENGSFNGYFDGDKHRFTFAYPEVTGYGISTMLELAKNDISGNRAQYLERAKKAADWLIDQLQNVGLGKAAPARQYYDKKDYVVPEYHEYYYAFDNGIIMNGLIDIYNVTRNEAYLKAARDIARFLMAKMKMGSAKREACCETRTQIPCSPGTGWSTSPGPYLAKISEGFINLHRTTGERRYLTTAIALCDAALKNQEKDGRFITFSSDKSTNLHPHCYAAEGLLHTARYLKAVGAEKEKEKAETYLRAATLATNWLLDHMSPRGEIRGFYRDGKFDPHERSDVLAQTLYLASNLLEELIVESRIKGTNASNRTLYRDVYLTSLANHLLEYQSRFGQGELFPVSGFKFGRDLAGVGKKDDINAWCTLFSIKALKAYLRIVIGLEEDEV